MIISSKLNFILENIISYSMVDVSKSANHPRFISKNHDNT
jgi:hypothetical protein